MTELFKDLFLFINGICSGVLISLAVIGIYNLKQIKKNLANSEKLLKELEALQAEAERK